MVAHYYLFKVVAYGAWLIPAQQDQHHLGTWWKYKFSGPTPHPWNKKFKWRWILQSVLIRQFWCTVKCDNHWLKVLPFFIITNRCGKVSKKNWFVIISAHLSGTSPFIYFFTLCCQAFWQILTYFISNNLWHVLSPILQLREQRFKNIRWLVQQLSWDWTQISGNMLCE